MNSYEDLDHFPVGTLMAVVITLAAARALWVRRSTWLVPWEVATSLNVVLQTVEILLITGPVSRWVGPKLHAITGLWNMEDLIGHLCYFCAMTFLAYAVLSKLDLSDRQLAWYTKRRIEVPATLFVAVVIAIFLAGKFGDHDTDMVLMHPNFWTRAYFLMYILADAYLLSMVIPALLILRRDRRQKRMATAYLCAVAITVLTCVIMLIGLPMATWLVIRVETAAYCIAASYSWHVRSRNLRGPQVPCPS